MEDALTVSRLQFAFTVTYHYLFPMLTMGLALLIFVLKSIYMRSGNELYNKSARFWGKIFAVTFVMGVVTGIPLEFQFGTNWAAFSAFAGDIIAQTLAMEGAFAFFLESAFVGLFLFGERAFRAEGALVLVAHGLPRHLGFGLLHHHHQLLDAEPCRLQGAGERQHRAERLLGGPAQPLDVRAVRAQHGRGGGVRVVRDGRARGLLPARAQGRGVRQDLRQGRRHGRRDRAASGCSSRAGTSPANRSPSKQPVALAAMEGHFEIGAQAGPGPYRPARRRGAGA